MVNADRTLFSPLQWTSMDDCGGGGGGRRHVLAKVGASFLLPKFPRSSKSGEEEEADTMVRPPSLLFPSAWAAKMHPSLLWSGRDARPEAVAAVVPA
jgi:hypothetical protein